MVVDGRRRADAPLAGPMSPMDDPSREWRDSMNARGQSVCLNMIVKNEAHVIGRCLATVRPLIDAWVISDTGSTDGTQALIRELLADIPGTLLERPWVDFAHNRTEVLEASRSVGDYSLIIDADDMLEIDDGFALPALDADAYNLRIGDASLSYHRKQLVRGALPWRYVGVLHEYIQCDLAQTEAFLEGVRVVRVREGARARDPLTYRRDAIVVEKALFDEPDNSRYVFYLAQSYRDAKEPELALRQYRRRTTMGGWRDEVWYSLYQIAHLEAWLNKPWPEVMASYLAAYQFLPDRAEPLYQIAMHYQSTKEFHTAKGFFEWATRVPTPGPTGLFVEQAMYDYLLELEHAVCCYYTGAHAQAIAINDRLLARGTLPDPLADQVRKNRQFSLDALGASANLASKNSESAIEWALQPRASAIPAAVS
jgi:glycosyltransferase involved in cell wall biosynthesis